MDTIDIKGDTALLGLLSDAPAEKLDLLVDHLTDTGGGRVMLPAAVKELLLESRRRGIYTSRTLQLLVGELQQFGGNSFMHMARRGAVPYSAIVDDVLKHVGGEADPTLSVKDKELRIINVGLADVWLDLTDTERASVLATKRPGRKTPASLLDAQRDVLRGGTAAAAAALVLSQRKYANSGLARKARTITETVDEKDRLGKLLPGALTDAGSTAFRVTVPCVMHIAYLRQNRTSKPPKPESTNQPLTTTPNHDSGTFLVGASPDVPLLSITAFPAGFVPQMSHQLDLGRSGVDRLAPILQAIPGQVVAGEVASHRYLKVVVDGPLTRAADGDGLRGFGTDASGKFKEHARFYENDRLKNLVNGAAILQLGSMVIAQKHLADISQKLGEIKQGIDRIEAFQKNERKATINGTMHYLQQMAPVILAGNCSSSVRDELESSEKALGNVQDHIHHDIKALISDVVALKNPDILGASGGLTKALWQRQKEFDDLAMQWQLCLAARFVACRLVRCYPGQRGLVERRQQILNALADSLLGSDGFLHEFPIAVSQRAASVKSRFDSLATIRANKERLRLWEVDRLPAMAQQARATFDQLDGMLSEDPRPVAMVLETRGDQVLRAMTI